MEVLNTIKVAPQINALFTVTPTKTDTLVQILLTNKENNQTQPIRVDPRVGFITSIDYVNNLVEYRVNKFIVNEQKGIKMRDKPLRFKIESNGQHYRRNSGYGWHRICSNPGCILISPSGADKCIRHASGKEKRKLLTEGNNVPVGQRSKVGEETEQYVVNILKSFPDVEVDWIAQTESDFDILYTLPNDVRRGLQVKTLTESKFQDNYHVAFSTKPNPDILLVFVNKKRDRFVVAFGRDLQVRGANFPFFSKRAKYRKFMVVDLDEFKKRLYDALNKSVEVTEDVLRESMPKENWKEYGSMLRLEATCLRHDLTYERAHNQNIQYDCVINGHKVQCKTTTRLLGYRYYFHISKCVRIKGEDTKIPYTEKDDFAYLVLEVLDNPDNFYIIPKDDLIAADKLKTTTCEGKVDMSVVSREIKGVKDWTDKFYNDFDLFI